MKNFIIFILGCFMSGARSERNPIKAEEDFYEEEDEV